MSLCCVLNFLIGLPYSRARDQKAHVPSLYTIVSHDGPYNNRQLK